MIERDAVPVAPSESVAVSWIVWVPTERSLRLKLPPVPIGPSSDEVQLRAVPVRLPSSESEPEPWLPSSEA